MTRLAAIDIGTNSTKITVADVGTDGALTVVSEDSEITRLGEGADAAGRLSEAAMARTLDVVARFAADARAGGASEVRAVGTSALRDASNGSDFLAQAKARSGVAVEVISGDREAQLAYTAVRADRVLRLPPEGKLLVFDIGGGSTELILGVAGRVGRHTSLNVGAVRLTERFLKSDPPTEYELAQASQLADDALSTFPEPDAAPAAAGVGGTVVNIAAVTKGLSRVDPDAVDGAVLTLPDVQAALDRFKRVPLAERRDIPGLEPKRADVITAGALLLARLLAYFHVDRFTVSARGLRYGLLAERAKPS